MSKQSHLPGEAELKALGSDELVAEVRAATDAGRPEQARTALAILCFRHLDDVQRRISIRVPAADVEDAAMTVMLAALQSTFDGSSVGEFVNWLNKIVDRRGIADYWRGREREPDEVALPSEHSGDDDVWGSEPAQPDETGGVHVQSLADACLEPLSEPHRLVIELNVYEDLDASATAERVNEAHPDLDPAMSVANVHQIVSRFRACLREKLADAEDGG